MLSGPSNKNAGRPPDEFKALCRELASNAETVKEVREILKDKHHPAYLGALKWAADRGYGLPSQPVDVTTAGKPLRFTLALGPLNGDSDG